MLWSMNKCHSWDKSISWLDIHAYGYIIIYIHLNACVSVYTQTQLYALISKFTIIYAFSSGQVFLYMYWWGEKNKN